MERCRIAVIGAGVAGLVTLKNALEEGFDSTAF
jgi:cation diffusion facilitator CzcD-associated flavoprotein CzcO